MRHPRRVGPVGRAAVLGVLLLGSLPSTATAEILADLRGTWAADPSGQPAMEWAQADDGFTVSWQPPGAEATTVQFSPAGRPGVYSGKAKAGWSMMDSMFGSAAAVNPLESGALFWARTAEDAVYLYRLVIDDRGGLEIDRYACRPDDAALAVSLQRRTAAGMADPVEQRLVRKGQ